MCAKQLEALTNPMSDTFNVASDASEKWHQLVGIDEQFFQQKSRIQWLKLGDQNTSFFIKLRKIKLQKCNKRLIDEEGAVITDLEK